MAGDNRLEYSATPQPARVATAANPITCLSRSEQFCFAPRVWTGAWNGCNVALCLLHYVNVAPLKSSRPVALKLIDDIRLGDTANLSEIRQVTSWSEERIVLKWTCPRQQSRICQNCSTLENLTAATWYAYTGKTIALKQDVACKNRRDSAAGRRGGVTGSRYAADIERYGCYPSILLLARSPMRPSTSTRNSAPALSRSATRFSGDPGKTII